MITVSGAKLTVERAPSRRIGAKMGTLKAVPFTKTPVA
jgi:hypothetical protein